MSLSVRVLFGAALAVAAIGAVGGGFLLVGSPEEARLQRLDDRRVSDLQQIQRAVSLQWTRTRHLPESIDAAVRETSAAEPLRDPTAQVPYDYRVLDGANYEVCATFDRASDGGPYPGDAFWSHPAGRACFRLVAADLNRPMPR